MKVRYVYDLQYYLLGFSCKIQFLVTKIRIRIRMDPHWFSPWIRIGVHIEVKIRIMIRICMETNRIRKTGAGWPFIAFSYNGPGYESGHLHDGGGSRSGRKIQFHKHSEFQIWPDCKRPELLIFFLF
jgi:hypothetical protein